MNTRSASPPRVSQSEKDSSRISWRSAANMALSWLKLSLKIAAYIIFGAINPLIIASQVFPKEALAPLFLVFLGFGVLPKIVISALICFFPIAINTFKGLEATPSAYRKLMHIVGASPWQRFVRCDLPFAAPYIFASLSVSATLSIIGAVVGEFVGSSAGLGHVIRAANADVGTERIYAALIILGAMGSLFYGITLFLGRVLFKRYTQSV